MRAFSSNRLMQRVAMLALAFAVATTTACGGDDKNPGTGPETGVVGNYSLKTIDGDPLPATIFDEIIDDEGEQYRLTIAISAGSMDLKADKSFTGSLTFKIMVEGEAPHTEAVPVNGTYTTSGNTVTLKPADPTEPSITAQITNGQITITADLLETGENFAMVYKR